MDHTIDREHADIFKTFDKLIGQIVEHHAHELDLATKRHIQFDAHRRAHDAYVTKLTLLRTELLQHIQHTDKNTFPSIESKKEQTLTHMYQFTAFGHQIQMHTVHPGGDIQNRNIESDLRMFHNIHSLPQLLSYASQHKMKLVIL